MVKEIITITATTATMGILTTYSLNTSTNTIKEKPAKKVESLVLAPDFALMIDCPTKAHPVIPPKSPEMIFPKPCALVSLFLSLTPSFKIISKVLAVNKLSIVPTSAKERA